MRIPQLSALLLAIALATAPSATAFATPATTVQVAAPESPKAPATSDAGQYAAREIKDTKAVAKFRGGGEVVVIGSTVTILLVVLLIVILL